MKRFKNILFVADREDGLGASLDRAAAVAQTNGARLTVMDVTPDSGLADYVRRTYAVDLNAQLREQRLQALQTLVQPYADAGLPPLPSQSNFLLARATKPSARELYESLKARRILVRYFNSPGLDDRLRITVGTGRQNDALIAALKELVR